MAHVDILDAGARARAEVRPWIRRLARLGLAARGLVYLMVGWLAAQQAFGNGGATTDTRGAIRHVGRGAFGDVLLALIALGLVGYAAWRFVQAIHDTDDKGDDAKGLATRAVFAGKGVVHLALAATPVQILLQGRDDGGRGIEDGTARLMAQPFGVWLVGIAGAVVIAAGLWQMGRGLKRHFVEHLDETAMSETVRTWAERAGTFGYVARGITFALIGGFLVLAAVRTDASQAQGLAEALATLLRQPFGPWLLGFVALGLVAFGLYSFVEARYRRIRT